MNARTFGKGAVVAALLLLTATATTAVAAPITFSLSGGVVATVAPSLSSLFSVGDPGSVTITYESSTTKAGGSDDSPYFANAITDLTFRIGSYVGSFDPADANDGVTSFVSEIDTLGYGVNKAHPGSAMFWAGFSPDAGGLPTYQFRLVIQDASLSLLHSDGTLPDHVDPAVLFFSAFSASFLVDTTPGHRQAESVIVDFNNLSGPTPPDIAQLPEPASLILLGGGLAGLVAKRAAHCWQ